MTHSEKGQREKDNGDSGQSVHGFVLVGADGVEYQINETIGTPPQLLCQRHSHFSPKQLT